MLSQEVERLTLINSQFLEENTELKRLKFKLDTK